MSDLKKNKDDVVAKVEEKKKTKEEDQKTLNKIIEDKVNTEDFICEIEKYPAIWDSTKDEYSNKKEKRNAWQNVITTFIEDFDERCAAEKNALVVILQKKWKGIRSCYSRELLKKKEEKSGAPASGRKQYVYFDILRFLDTTSKKTENSIEDGVHEGEPEEDEIAVETTMQPMSNETSIASTAIEQNEDRLFLLSLVKELQKVPASKKLKLKADIITAIDSAQKQSVIQPSQQGFFGYQQPPSQVPWNTNSFGNNTLLTEHRQVQEQLQAPSMQPHYTYVSPSSLSESSSHASEFAPFNN